MFSVIFPGQGSQSVGMAKDLYNKFSIVKNIFKIADDVLKFPISKIILDGPETELNLTKNTQPAIFIVSYSIFSIIKSEFNINLNTAKYSYNLDLTVGSTKLTMDYIYDGAISDAKNKTAGNIYNLNGEKVGTVKVTSGLLEFFDNDGNEILAD